MAWLLKQLLKSAHFSLYKSQIPVGRFLGNTDVHLLTDFPYVILVLLLANRPIFTGHFRNA